MKYLTIADNIIKNIETGVYKDNERLPAEKKQAEIWQVSVNTIKKAMEHLINLGYIRVINQSGYYINSQNIRNAFANHRIDKIDFTQRFRTVVNTFEVKNADENIALKLNLETGSKIFIFECSHFDNEDNLVLIQHYFSPANIVKGISSADIESSIYEFINKRHQIYLIEQKLISTGANREFKFFHNPNLINSDNIFEIEQIGYLDDGKVFEYSINYFFSNYYPIKILTT